MNNNYTAKSILFICYLLLAFVVRSQQVSTVYFMDNVPLRNTLNPAFQPLGNFYFSPPVVGYTGFYMDNNSVALKDIIYKQNNKSIWFLHPEADKSLFYNALQPNTLITTEWQVNLLGVGFRSGRSFWNFSLVEKYDGRVNIPKDMARFLLYLTPDLDYNYFNFKDLGFNSTLYTEAGIGYARRLNDKWSVGAKVKLNLGAFNASSDIQNFDVLANAEEWKLNGRGTLNLASPMQWQTGNSLDSLSFSTPASVGNWIKPSGTGAGIDLGFTFKPIDNLTFSGALLDFGFIRWNKNVENIDFNGDYNFTGFGSYDVNSENMYFNFDFESLADSIITGLKKSVTTTRASNSYTTYTTPKLNLGVEYAFLNDKLSLGLLSATRKFERKYSQEFTASVNGRPIDWFNMSASYSVLNGRQNSFGAGIGIRTGIVHWFASADYIPVHYAYLPLKDLNPALPKVKLPLPYRTQQFNMALGINFILGYRRDADKDGVVDRKDKCPDTLLGMKVDKDGCPLDSDGDGVYDDADKCPDTPPAAYKFIDINGCPVDTDGDGVPDYLDKCPDTPAAAKGFVDLNGCELDSDSDSIPDYLDKCPKTPAGVKVDENGCPTAPESNIEPVAKPEKAIDKEDKPTATVVEKPVVKKEVDLKPEYKSLFQKALQGIQFETGNDRILPASYKILNQIAGVMIANQNYLIEVRGFTDNVGTADANLVLSKKRANAVRKFLIQNGVQEERISASGFGATLPVAPNNTAQGRAQNRRVEFIVSYEEITIE